MEIHTQDDLLSLYRCLPKNTFDMRGALWPGKYSHLRGLWQAAPMEVEVLIVRPLWRARRGKQGCRRVEGGWGKREQGRGDLLRCCTSWEGGKEQTDCSKKSTQRVSTWKHLARLSPKREAMHALWDGLVQETLGLMEDFPRTALLAASVCLISDYSVPRTPGVTQVMKRYAWTISVFTEPMVPLRGGDQSYTETCTILFV